MKKTASLLLLILFFMNLAGCRLIRIEEEERKPLSYSVTEPGQLPEEAQNLVEERKAEEFQMTYQSGEELYLIKGYGRQLSGGYSIQVKEVSLSRNAVFFHTELKGPPPEKQSGEPSYPYIAVKIKYREEPVQFQ